MTDTTYTRDAGNTRPDRPGPNIEAAQVEAALARRMLDAQSPRPGASSSSKPPSPYTPRVRSLASRLDFSSSDDSTIISHLTTLFQQARAHRSPLVRQWQRNYRLLLNRYWSANRPDYFPSPQVPEIFPIVASNVGWMTDQRFRWDITAQAEPYSLTSAKLSEVATQLEVLLGSSWHNNAEELEFTMGLWDANIYGTGIFKTTWDQSLFGNMGDAKFHRVDPFTFYPDPRARSLQDANYLIEVRTMSIQELDRRWPGSGKHFRDGGMIFDTDEAPDQLSIQSNTSAPRANPGAISPATSPRYGRPSSPSQAPFDDPGVTVFECWLREHEYIESPSGDIVYDTWRVVVFAGDRIIMNEPVESLWSHGSHPYDRYVPYDMGEFWGLALVQMLTSSQVAINRILASLQHNIELTGNPVFVEDTRTGLQRTKITNVAGQRLTKSPNSSADWLTPPPVHPLMGELLRYYLQRMEAVSGLSAVTKGGSQPGRNAQGVIDAMQEAAFVRIRMQLRSTEYTLRSIGLKKASLIAENYTAPRVLAAVGEDGQKLNVALETRPFQQFQPNPDGPASFTPLNFSILVDAGSGTHTSRKVREDTAFTLYTLGAIDEMALLEAVDFPNRAEVAERVAKLKATGALQPPGKRSQAKH